MNSKEQYLIDELTNLAYRYYPLGISDTEDAYFLTEQFKLHNARLDEFKEKYERGFSDLLSGITANTRIRCEDISGLYYHDMCVKARLWRDKPVAVRILVLYISFAIPFYVLYESVDRFAGFTITDFHERSYISEIGTPENVEIAKLIEAKIPVYFPGIERLPTAVRDAPVDNVQFDGVGRILGMEGPGSVPMTIFNCFFSNQYF
ncbi:hypothetical protein [Chitinophaga parva]|uniref:hypothetical protein n=1 Tax=Chitinophaga parva TaxID=2169414 RepID=UPI001403FE62|nr:hypothetical protein [Chitinophaga parva]